MELERRAALQGTHVHPADLDGALQSTALLARGDGSGGETRLPFAVDVACLRGVAAGLLQAGVVAQGAGAADLSLAAAPRACKVGKCLRAPSM